MTSSYLSSPAPKQRPSGTMEGEGESESAEPRNFPSAAQLMLTRYLSDLQDADTPANPIPPKWHTGRLPNNSRLGDGKPRLLLMGQRSSFMDFQIWDFPGHLDYFDPAFDVDNIFGEIGALIWVIDAQDEYLDAINRLNTTILNLQQHYPSINVEVFVHKVDGLSEDYKSDTFRDIIQRVQDELSDNGYENAPVSFYQTSIYDHSIFEAFSKVIQKLIPQLPTLESLLNSLCSTCRIEKAYLFDVLSKIYIATDTSPTDIGSYEICSDYIDVIVDMSEIYGWERSDALPEDTEGQIEGKKVSEDKGNNDAESLITMERKGNHYLYLREINKYLALICLMGEDDPSEKKALVDYNVSVFQEAIEKVFQR
ncbi:MAG: hypothetical protein M1820_003537 [Bogoriella megaspora]|nr:MAG: hypothetical protein M1820_003537 [Bogoriella megaspora]